MRFLLPLVLSCVCLGSFSAHAFTVPDSCLGCRFADNQQRFRQCLEECLSEQPAVEMPREQAQPKVTPTKKRGPSLEELAEAPKPVPNPLWRIEDGIATIDSPQTVSYLDTEFIPRFHVLQNDQKNGFLFVMSVAPLTIMAHENPTVGVKIDSTDFKIKPQVVMDGHAVLFENQYFEKHFSTAQSLTVTLNIVGVETKHFQFNVSGIESIIHTLTH